jgi:hypothetical protein
MILLGDHNSTEGLVPSETPEIVIAGSGEFSSRRLPQLLGRPTTGEGPETSKSQRRVQEWGPLGRMLLLVDSCWKSNLGHQVSAKPAASKPTSVQL